jgi:hypothetical protein
VVWLAGAGFAISSAMVCPGSPGSDSSDLDRRSHPFGDVGLCVSSNAGLPLIDLGPLERNGEVLSGAFTALAGLVLLPWTGR